MLHVLQSSHITTVNLTTRSHVLQYEAKTNVINYMRQNYLQFSATTEVATATAPIILSAKYLDSQKLSEIGILDFPTVSIKIQGIPNTQTTTTGFHITKTLGHPTESYTDITYRIDIDRNGVGFFVDKLQNPTPWTTYTIKQIIDNLYYSLPTTITFTTKIEI